MATYYVRPDGNNANAGTGSTAGQAWQTVQYALTNATLTTGVNYIYIAPGVYRESVTLNITPTSSNTLVISGDPNAAQFSGVTQGVVRLTNFVTDNANPTSSRVFFSNGKSFFTLQNMYIDGFKTGDIIDTALVDIKSCTNVTVSKMTIVNTGGASFDAGCYISSAASNTNIVIERSYFMGTAALIVALPSSGTVYNPEISIRNCHAIGTYAGIMITANGASVTTSNGVNVYNCTVYANTRCIWFNTSNTTTPSTLYNSLLIGIGSTTGIVLQTANVLIENFNKIRCSSAATNITTFGANTTTTGSHGIDHNYSRIVGLPNLSALQSYYLSPNANAGTSTGAPSTDIYGATWSGVNPDIGAGTYATPGNVGVYNPSERNASTITIAPGSTSQSIELYLGVTGLTASTSGLSAYYNRTRSADVQINLQARNITQNWTSGGFAEVNANTMPGVYRLDIPNEALTAGADDVTVVVRGASGTNGAVMSIKLSSGGLTSAQTASAVWDAATTSYTNNGSFGLNLLRADQQNKQGLVTLSSAGNVNRVDADVHAIANDIAAATALKGALNHDGTGYVDSDVVRISTSTAAANELEGALLHNGTDYIDSNLLSGNSTQVFVGRFQLTQTGTTQGDIIEAFTTDTPSFELQLFDGDNNIVSVTGATLGLRILDVTSTVVETGTPTIEYGTGGIVRWTAPGSYVSIGCPAGMYRLFVDRTVSGTTTTFGPLQIKVQVQ